MFENEIRKSRILSANRDFDLLLTPGNAGFYTSCEVTQIFLLNRRKKSVKNYFTLFCFSENESIEQKSRFLLPEPEKIYSSYSLGIIQKRITLDSARQAFFDIQNGKLNYEGECEISGNFALLPKTYVSSLHTTSSVFLNYVLKPNYWGDNYVIEFFDESKNFFEADEITEKAADKNFGTINKIINSVKEIKIDLSKVYDRIGNIIFQFPITVLKTDLSSKNDSLSLRVRAFSHPSVLQKKNFHIQVFSKFDNVITGFSERSLSAINFDEVFDIGDDNNLNTLVSDSDTGLILHNSEINFIREVCIGGKFGIQYSCPRTLLLSDGSSKNIELFHRDDFGIKTVSKAHDYFERIHKRNRNSDIILKSGDYRIFKKKQKSQALDYIRNKILELSACKEICLWDPYLTASDIIDTLYFENTGLPFRCITSYQTARKFLTSASESQAEEMTFEYFCKKQEEYFESHSNNLRIKLKFLAQHDGYGWKFHDRFLIFLPSDPSELPDVFSLGTSVNSVGNNHHIIQKVTNPREIYENFEELWALLDNGKCLVKEFK